MLSDMTLRVPTNNIHLGQHSRKGFTLIEVLVTLSILAITVTAVFMAFSTGMKFRNKTREYQSFGKETRQVISLLNSDLLNLIPTFPGPLIGEDKIVLWRYPVSDFSGITNGTVPQLIVYGWSHPTDLDSVMVRVSIPALVDVGDWSAVQQLTIKGEKLFSMTGQAISPINSDQNLRSGPLNNDYGLEGQWMAFPHLKSCSFKRGGDGGQSGSSGVLMVSIRCGLNAKIDELESFDVENVSPESNELGIADFSLPATNPREIEAIFWVPGLMSTPQHGSDSVKDGGQL